MTDTGEAFNISADSVPQQKPKSKGNTFVKNVPEHLHQQKIFNFIQISTKS